MTAEATIEVAPAITEYVKNWDAIRALPLELPLWLHCLARLASANELAYQSGRLPYLQGTTTQISALPSFSKSWIEAQLDQAVLQLADQTPDKIRLARQDRWAELMPEIPIEIDISEPMGGTSPIAIPLPFSIRKYLTPRIPLVWIPIICGTRVDFDDQELVIVSVDCKGTEVMNRQPVQIRRIALARAEYFPDLP